MKLSDTLTRLAKRQHNHRMIVHGIHGERVIIPLTLIQFICATANNRDYYALAHAHCNFPIKEVILNRYSKPLTDEQYSALLTFLLHCRDYPSLKVSPNATVVYKSSTELKYDKDFRAALDADVAFCENVYSLGFDTGEISIVDDPDRYLAKEVSEFLTVVLINLVPDECFEEEDPNNNDVTVVTDD